MKLATLIVAIIVIVMGLVLIVTYRQKSIQTDQERCENLGGVWFRSYGGGSCTILQK